MHDALLGEISESDLVDPDKRWNLITALPARVAPVRESSGRKPSVISNPSSLFYAERFLKLPKGSEILSVRGTPLRRGWVLRDARTGKRVFVDPVDYNAGKNVHRTIVPPPVH